MSNSDITVILVHGAWSDGQMFNKILPLLIKKGVMVKVVQNPLTGIEDDIKKTLELIDLQEGKVLLVGHSYGGVVISAAGNHEKVCGLVYLCAFIPDQGENVQSILCKFEKLDSSLNYFHDKNGNVWFGYEKFHESMYQDFNDYENHLTICFSQKPVSTKIFIEKLQCIPAWKKKPSWCQISENDRMIHPQLLEYLAERIKPIKKISLKSGHCPQLTNQNAILEFILEVLSFFK
ncbi:hypothetical protein RB653_003835 [Dictyostelium firmibasis]|uniref:AB hydrolase-1 domain-containing protein n=1 Tax=Dictyostelium firmibasis TaxID=79012 RepID=A0AAN7U5E8_9MYCE